MRMVMPILLAINRSDDVRAAVELHAFGGGDTFKSLGAHTDGGRQSELGATDGHVAVGAAGPRQPGEAVDGVASLPSQTFRHDSNK